MGYFLHDTKSTKFYEFSHSPREGAGDLKLYYDPKHRCGSYYRGTMKLKASFNNVFTLKNLSYMTLHISVFDKV